MAKLRLLYKKKMLEKNSNLLFEKGIDFDEVEIGQIYGNKRSDWTGIVFCPSHSYFVVVVVEAEIMVMVVCEYTEILSRFSFFIFESSQGCSNF